MAATRIMSIHINKGENRQAVYWRTAGLHHESEKDGRRNSGFDLLLLARNGGG
mgnify:FL=1